MSAYTTLRGVKTDNRPLLDLSKADRRNILSDYLKLGSKATKLKWNISTQTMAHLKHYNQELIEQIEDEHWAEFGL